MANQDKLIKAREKIYTELIDTYCKQVKEIYLNSENEKRLFIIRGLEKLVGNKEGDSGELIPKHSDCKSIREKIGLILR